MRLLLDKMFWMYSRWKATYHTTQSRVRPILVDMEWSCLENLILYECNSSLVEVMNQSISYDEVVKVQIKSEQRHRSTGEKVKDQQQY